MTFADILKILLDPKAIPVVVMCCFILVVCCTSIYHYVVFKPFCVKVFNLLDSMSAKFETFEKDVKSLGFTIREVKEQTHENGKQVANIEGRLSMIKQGNKS